MSKALTNNYPKYILRRFHINTPIYGAWKMFGWKQGTWGLGLLKKRIDNLANNNMVCIISYNITKDKASNEYTIKAKRVKEYPLHTRNDGLQCYVVPVFALNRKK